jgi:hypothetical protein
MNLEQFYPYEIARVPVEITPLKFQFTGAGLVHSISLPITHYIERITRGLR